eukprot:scaffold8019_cov487-Pinguiococcus_pyrenoidosus.AAC.1
MRTASYKDVMAVLTPKSTISALVGQPELHGRISEANKIKRRLGHLTVEEFTSSPPSLLSRIAQVSEAEIADVTNFCRDRVLVDRMDVEDVEDAMETKEVSDDNTSGTIDIVNSPGKQSNCSEEGYDSSFVEEQDDFGTEVEQDLVRHIVKGIMNRKATREHVDALNHGIQTLAENHKNDLRPAAPKTARKSTPPRTMQSAAGTAADKTMEELCARVDQLTTV